MKRDDIHIGRTYTDGKGAFRHVFAAVQVGLLHHRIDKDCISYRLARLRSDGTANKSQGGFPRGQMRCTRASLASWAKAEVASDDVPPVVMKALLA